MTDRMTNAKKPTAAMEFRKRPVGVEAFQWVNQDRNEWPAWAAEDDRLEDCAVLIGVVPVGLKVWTAEGAIRASHGDWIIKGIQGELYPCKPDIFAATYDALEPAAHWTCGALKQGTAGGNDPADCDYPHCGCEPAAPVEDGELAAVEKRAIAMMRDAADREQVPISEWISRRLRVAVEGQPPAADALVSAEVQCALALFRSLKRDFGEYRAVKVDGELNWTITKPRTPEALLAALETIEPSPALNEAAQSIIARLNSWETFWTNRYRHSPPDAKRIEVRVGDLRQLRAALAKLQGGGERV